MLKRIWAVVSNKTFYRFIDRVTKDFGDPKGMGVVLAFMCKAYGDGELNLSPRQEVEIIRAIEERRDAMDSLEAAEIGG